VYKGAGWGGDRSIRSRGSHSAARGRGGFENVLGETSEGRRGDLLGREYVPYGGCVVIKGRGGSRLTLAAGGVRIAWKGGKPEEKEFKEVMGSLTS